ncbi:hypothetical protein IQ265_14840 [Nodosilinea sp. LEGE 06152]|uniref:hypothetical protein n=1 Tax=Nodosilinea sp. LEGE 06152 TaxID=2777966 RepID=UPI001882A4EC|nr:hypothetical protein [Nodosilinea sp. LEGE 06152]MBE9158094.1 hypothetical protein [Nodosilinea sp. LEGE 06152]
MTEQYTHRGIGFFPEEEQAEKAIRALESSGFPMEQVSIIAKQLEKDTVAGGATTGHQVQGQDINASRRLPEQANTGALWGGLLGGLSAFAIPGGLGAVLAVGSVGAAFAGVVAGQGAGALATQNLKEGLKSLGIPDEKVGGFSDRLINQDFMVIIEGSQAEINQVETALTDHDIQAWNIYPMPQS